jgi:flagellar basal-body rod protein FlgC
VDPLIAASKIAASGLSAQSVRVRVATENVANAHSTARSPAEEPYRRKLISFEGGARDNGAVLLVGEIVRDQSPFRMEHEPGHRAANAAGFVAYPNVDVMTELADIREANRAYVANLQIIKQTRDAVNATIDLLRAS